MLAACEPVAMTTTVALHLLGKHPALQDRIADEITKVKIPIRGRAVELSRAA